jgi:hypothetical protein
MHTGRNPRGHYKYGKENQNMRHNTLKLVAALGAFGVLAACSKQDAPPATEAADIAAELADKQAEVAKLEADLAAQQAAATPPPPAAAAPAPAPKPAATAKPASTKPATSSPPKPAVVRSITVPAGTELNLALASALSSKTAKVGEPVRALLTSDVVVDGRTAIAQGTTVAGSVVKVVSGSDKIGGTPTLVLAFDRLELPGGVDVPISGEFESKGKSDNTRDAVKIVGGAAAGALIADQVSKKDKNKVIGGIIGAAAGAVAAKETGTEVKLDEGSALTLTLSAPVEVTRS